MGLVLKNFPISSYMTAYPISVEPDVPLIHAVNFMAERGFGNLVVSDGVMPKGILTEREILSAIVGSKDLGDLKVKDIGWQPYVKLSLGHTVLDATHQMISKKSRVLVFDENKLVGIVTVSDLLRAFRKIRTESILNDVINTNIEKCKSSDSILNAVKRMHGKKIGSVIIEDMKGYGIFTERDLLLIVASNKFYLSEEVGKVSSSPLIVSKEGISVHEAAGIMAYNNIKRLGITKNNSLVGIVTARDLVNEYQNTYSVNTPDMNT